MWYENIDLLTDNFTPEYLFKSSPESCSTENSFVPENFECSSESISDEDFMTQLSSDLDIPLLLNPGDDEMGLLNSFLDKSPDEILSEVTPISPFSEDCDMKDDIDIKELDLLFQDNINNIQESIDNAQANDNNQLEIKAEIHSDESCSSRNSAESTTPPPQIHIKKSNSPPLPQVPKILPKQEFVQAKVAIKRVPIKPKVSVPNSNIVLIKDIKTKFTPNNNCNNIVVLDNRPVGLSYINKPVVNIPQITIPNNNRNIDPKMLKRQERRIKNRESASISRKKKKEYLNLLEDQVQALNAENQRLKEENRLLNERLSMYENNKNIHFNNIAAKVSKPAIALCVFLLVVGINLNVGNFRPGLNPNKVASNSLKVNNHYGRNLLWASENVSSQQFENKTYFSPLTMCPASINQTESARLLLELEKWIGKPEEIPLEHNVTKPKPKKNKIKRKKLRLDLSLARVKKQERFGPDNEPRNEIQVFSPKEDVLYADFFDAINRQGDTFYVVSFSDQHMLLPALHHNNTRRPKMSLLMPFVFPNDTSTQTYFPLMQIDCEVLDTKLVHINYATIPSPYRQYGNFTKQGSDKNGADDDSRGPKDKYRPYFLDKSNK